MRRIIPLYLVIFFLVLFIPGLLATGWGLFWEEWRLFPGFLLFPSSSTFGEEGSRGFTSPGRGLLL